MRGTLVGGWHCSPLARFNSHSYVERSTCSLRSSIGGAKLKAKGHPVGISLGHSNDPSTTWRGLLWLSDGAAAQQEAGR
jgi:hypothetical protein